MENNVKDNYIKMLFTAFGITAVLLLLLGSATYAWFTNNSKVSTTTATGRSSSSSMKFLIGENEGNLQDTSLSDFEIPQVNETDMEKLYPVSTEDLQTFLYASAYDNEGRAVAFTKDENETNLYHGRLYFRLDGENITEDTKYKLYLDTADTKGGILGESADGYLLNAARLGLLINEQNPLILYFHEDAKGDSRNNTVVNGAEIGNGFVLDNSGNAVPDPAEETSVYSMNSSMTNYQVPEKSLGEFEINKTYPMEVYFYLEGCDEDCVEAIAKEACDIHLAFYAVTE